VCNALTPRDTIRPVGCVAIVMHIYKSNKAAGYRRPV